MVTVFTHLTGTPSFVAGRYLHVRAVATTSASYAAKMDCLTVTFSTIPLSLMVTSNFPGPCSLLRSVGDACGAGWKITTGATTPGSPSLTMIAADGGDVDSALAGSSIVTFAGGTGADEVARAGASDN